MFIPLQAITLALSRQDPADPGLRRTPPRPRRGGRCEAGGVTTIRDLRADDWDGWLALWSGYLAFYRAELSEETTRATFERLCAGRDGMFGLLAVDDEGRAVGMANCVIHATTWSRQPKCYLEDLFVAPSARGQDSAGRCWRRSSSRRPIGGRPGVYWHTQQYNGRARSLYDQVARPTSFVVYEM